jgi:hypothetical protein
MCKKQKNTYKDSLKMLDNEKKAKFKPILDLLKWSLSWWILVPMLLLSRKIKSAAFCVITYSSLYQENWVWIFLSFRLMTQLIQPVFSSSYFRNKISSILCYYVVSGKLSLNFLSFRLMTQLIQPVFSSSYFRNNPSFKVNQQHFVLLRCIRKIESEFSYRFDLWHS